MALSRPYVLVLLAAVLGVGTLLAFQSAGQSASAKDDNTAPVVTGAPKTPAKKTPTPAAKTPSTTSTAPAAKPKAATKPKPKPKPDTGVPPRVQRALKTGDTVVLFFRQPAADDAAVAAAVAELKGVERVEVFSDRLAHIGRYRRVVADLGITQAPAVVVVGKDKKARLIEGYIDPASLRQQVQDARR